LGVYQLIERFSNRGPTEHPMVPILATAPGWQTKLFLVAVACVVVPVLEETLFRGVLYRALRRHWSFTPAAIASGLVFSVSHLNPTAMIPYLLLGILFAYLYERTGSLLAPAVAHGAFNAYTLVVVLAIFG
jgi:membrane protease YdiL (CAAX protease family)